MEKYKKIPPSIKISEIHTKQGRGRPKTLDKTDFLNQAMHTFWFEGPEVSMNTLCERACVAKPSIYREFGNEDGLMSAALEKYRELMTRNLNDLLLGPLTFDKKLKSLTQFISEDPQYQYGCFFGKIRAARLDKRPKTKTKVREMENEILDVYKNFFKQSRKNHEWESELSDTNAAKFLKAQIELAGWQRSIGVKSSEVKSVLELAVTIFYSPPKNN
jgi:AcrR family transcriptional regulator